MYLNNFKTFPCSLAISPSYCAICKSVHIAEFCFSTTVHVAIFTDYCAVCKSVLCSLAIFTGYYAVCKSVHIVEFCFSATIHVAICHQLRGDSISI